MRRWLIGMGALCITGLGCSSSTTAAPGAAQAGPKAAPAVATVSAPAPSGVGNAVGSTGPGQWRGFDRNDYPGDDVMARMRQADQGFAFAGYWLTNPPGENSNSWTGKRALLRAQGWGFLVLANGRLDAEILTAQKTGTTPAALGQRDAADAVSAARREGFPPHTIVFLDQEEGGRLLAEQAAYLLAWTEAVAASNYRPGVYASGQSVEDGPGATIDTIQDVRARVATGKLHPVAIFDALDQCPPAPGCTMQPKPLSAAPDAGVTIWQYAQSPRRPEITKSCGATYAPDGNCYAAGFPQVFLDLDVAGSADPSNGR